jgi:signal peptidase I
MPVILYLCVVSAALFSATCFLPSLEIAFLGFPIALLFTGAFAVQTWRFLKAPDRKKLGALRKLLEYLPFALLAGFVFRRSGEADCSFAYDLVSVLLWLAASGLSVVNLVFLSEKRIEKRYPDIGPYDGKKKTLAVHGLEWIDALVQAACIVLLIDLFLFQLYAIPSESMVPQFMIGDRVIVPKVPPGPKFPLSDVGIPRMQSYKRGDIVVFSNPHYNDSKEARVRSFASQLVYKITFTLVNINRDEFGNVKADPLVKRVTGVPGEKLMLVDGVLYHRTKGQSDFTPVPEDQTWACWNLDALPMSEKSQVKAIMLSKEDFALMESIESTRANVDVAGLAKEANALVAKFAALKATRDTVTETPDLYPQAKREIVSLFQSNDDLTRTLLTTNGGLAWFRDFMTAWTKDTARANLFDTESFHINLLLKMDLGRLIVRNAELFAAGATDKEFAADVERNAIVGEANTYNFYMNLHDQRNMGEFPAGDEYIPADNYFMMGDNRFNSLDMRHSYEYRLTPIDPADPFSFVHRSNLSPQYVPVSRILGTANIRFWPLTRVGLVK